MSRIIVQADGPVLIDDISCPIVIRVDETKKAWIAKDLSDAEKFTGVSRAEIVAMADASADVEEKAAPVMHGFAFAWPTATQIKKEWQYPVTRRGGGDGKSTPIAVPCEVTLTPAPGSRARMKLFYRSITSCCTGWGMSKDTFDVIANQHIGWQEALPPMMSSIRTNVKPPKGYVKDGTPEDGPLFGIKVTKKGVLVNVSKLAGRRFPRVQDVPEAVLANSDWLTR